MSVHTVQSAADDDVSEVPPGALTAHGVRHVAIIMDGNGRWARARGLSRSAGHRAGVEAVRRTVEAARDFQFQSLTLYSFSTENWRRPATEIADLMALLREFISNDLRTLKNNGVRVKIIGDRESLDFDLRALVNHAEKETEKNDRFLLQIAFNYGGRDELVRAAQRLAQEAKVGCLDPLCITEADLAAHLDTQPENDPDLVIRTSGEKRTSNFLLWQAAYAEYVFLDVFWPDFGVDDLAQALRQYAKRERRFGGVGTAAG